MIDVDATEKHEADKQNLKISVASNLSSIENILKDICSKMRFQVLGNIENLEHIEFREDGTDGIKAFRKHNLDCLITNPVKQLISRIEGVNKIVRDLEFRLRQ